LRLAARRLVISQQTEIAIIAAALLRHGTLSGDQIIELANDRNESLSQQSQWRGRTIVARPYGAEQRSRPAQQRKGR
jgi:hypothetical protein